MVSLTIPLFFATIRTPKIKTGDVAKWQGKGLQNPDHGFKSRRRLNASRVSPRRGLRKSRRRLKRRSTERLLF